MRPDKIFISLAVLVLALIAGAWAWSHWIAKPKITTKVEWFEKPIIIQPKSESHVGMPVPPSAHPMRETSLTAFPHDSTNIDSLKARNIALEALLAEKTNPFTTTFEDTLEFSDSLVSFRGREINTIDCDPWTRIITKTRIFKDAILKAAHVTTIETTTSINWFVTAIAFLLGVLTAISLS